MLYSLVGCKGAYIILMNNMQRKVFSTECCCCCIFTESPIEMFGPLSKSSHVLAASEKLRKQSAQYFPGWSCKSHCLEIKQRKNQRESVRWRRQGEKRIQILNNSYWPCVHAVFSVQCLSAGLCYWSEDLTEAGIHKYIYIFHKHNFFSLYISHTHTHTPTHTRTHTHTRPQLNSSHISPSTFPYTQR